MFTIEVEKKKKDEDFSFEDLEMFHQECYGGKIKITQSKLNNFPKGYNLICQRCKSEKEIEISDVIEIIKTAVDKEERELELSGAPYVNLPDNIIKVI
jgi:hypothetical protein